MRNAFSNYKDIDIESFDKWKSCLLRKMIKSPFTGKLERVEQFLDLVHIDVCRPISITARGVFSYFIIFTNDDSRYGYVYMWNSNMKILKIQGIQIRSKKINR